MQNSTFSKFVRAVHHRRFHSLFVSLIVMAMCVPFVKGGTAGQVLFYGVLCLNLLAAVIAVSDRRRPAYFAGALLLIAFITSTWSTFFESKFSSSIVSHTVADATAFVAFAVVATLILKNVLTPGPVDTEKIFAAVCVYMLSGIAWGLLYVLIYINDHRAFLFAFDEPWLESGAYETSSLFSVFCYFSFVTMTTLGYGDILPASEVSRTLAWLQAVLGQLYVAILIAWLVGLHSQSARYKAAEDSLTGE